MMLGFALLLAAGMAIFVASPLLSAEGAGGSLPVDVTLATDLKRRRLVVYENLQDLEFEYKSGKIAVEDYHNLRQSYMGEAAQLMLASQETELAADSDAMIEREIASRRARRKAEPPEDFTCPECGYENPLPVKFCGECGARMARTPGKK
jgi:hypothetical protein